MVDAVSTYKLAMQADDNGDYDGALARIEEGLAAAPRNLPLLGLKGTVLLKLRDYAGALAAYQAYLDAGAKGANRRDAQKIVNSLQAARSTSLAITLSNGPASIYLDSKTQGVLCTAAPLCTKAALPGDYKVIAERPGFELWTGHLTIQSGQAAKLAITLVDKPSPLTVHVAQPGARVTVDDMPYSAGMTVPAGSHRIAAGLAGFVDARLELTAGEGKQVDATLDLVPLVPLRVEPLRATLLLDGRPVAIDHGGIAVPPGAHTLVVRAAGYRERTIALAADRAADYELAVELPRIEAPAPPSSIFTGRRALAVSLAGASLVIASGGVMFGLQSSQLADDALAVCPAPPASCAQAARANELNQRGRTRSRDANVAYGVAGAALTAGAILWFTGGPESRVAVTPRTGTTTGVDLTVSF